MYIEASGTSLKVIGATSRGSDQCELGDGIYTNLSFYRKWMADTFKTMGKPLNYLTDGSEPDWSNAAKIKIDVNTLLP
jgi:secreted trypsin-like serine protease